MIWKNKVPKRSDWTKDIANQINGLVCVCCHGKIEFINRAGLNVLGITNVSDIIGKDFLSFTQEEYREMYSELLTESAEGPEGLSVPMKLLVSDGTTREMDVAFRPLYYPETSTMLIESHNISARTHAIDTLRDAYENLEARVAERARELTREIEERRRAEATLRLTAQVISRLNEGVVSLDADFRITSVNPAFTRITGYSEDEIMDHPPPFFSNMGDDNILQKQMHETLVTGRAWDGEFWDTTKTGTRYAANLSVSPVGMEGDELVQYVAILTDVTKRKEDEERIRYQANFDIITDLPNRSLFLDRLTQAIANTGRADQKLGLLFIDLDGFKLINDTLGHDVGDELLRETSQRLQKCVRTGDTVARIGGDEFTVVMPSLIDGNHINVVAQRILNALSSPFHVSEQEAVVSASIGVALFPDDGNTPGELLKNADRAMYSVKESGKASFQFYTPALNEESQERLAIKKGVLRAFERGEFDVVYQPKLNLKTEEIDSVEALLRWHNDELGNVPPIKFISMLEETGQAIDIGTWVLDRVCKQHKTWLHAGLPSIRVAINLFARQLRDSSFVDLVLDTMTKTGIAADSLEVEITEGMLIADSERAVVTLEKLHSAGIRIAMDDFGTGYSSLNHLKNFPIDTIKIDRSFIADITTSTDDAEIIRTIISMGHTLNRRVIAEGVETKEQLDMLVRYQCDEIQGHYLSHPLSSAETTTFLQSYHRA